jgi:hypothetical protein
MFGRCRVLRRVESIALLKSMPIISAPQAAAC